MYLYYKTAKEIWETVQELYYGVENTAKFFEIRSAIRTTRHGNSTVTECCTVLTELWQEMDSFYEIKCIVLLIVYSIISNWKRKEYLIFFMVIIRTLMKPEATYWVPNLFHPYVMHLLKYAMKKVANV